MTRQLKSKISTLVKVGICILIFPSCIIGQEIMQPEDVIRLCIAGNFDIQIARNNEIVTKNNNNLGLVGSGQSTGSTLMGGSTGMLPQISIQAGNPQNPLGYGQTITTLKYQNPSINVLSQKLTSTSYAPSIVGTWYFFDGFKMFVTKRKLNKAEELSNLQYRQTVENTIFNVLSIYYTMVGIQRYIRSLKASLELAEGQLILAEEKLKTGNGTQVELLQAKIDANNLEVSILQQLNLLNEQAINLNNLLKRSPESPVLVPDTLAISSKPDYGLALNTTSQNNISILIGKKNLEIDELALKEFKANRMPKIGVTGNYTYQRTANDIGFVRLNQNFGYNAGLIFSWTLLNNFTTRTAIKNQSVQINSDQLRMDAATLQENSNLYKAFIGFKNNLEIMEIEIKSVAMAKENLQLAADRYKIGISTYLDFRTVNVSYENALYRYSQALSAAKISELNYLKVQNLLVH